MENTQTSRIFIDFSQNKAEEFDTAFEQNVFTFPLEQTEVRVDYTRPDGSTSKGRIISFAACSSKWQCHT